MGNKTGTKRGPYIKGRGYSYIDGYRVLNSQQGHPLASSVGQVVEHRKVLYAKIGPGEHPCHWCGKSLTWGGPGGIIPDHVDFDKLNNDIDNLVVACSRCNTRRSREAKRGRMR